MAKVLLLNGSPKADGCTATALNEMIAVFNEEGIETEVIHVGKQDIRGCVSCGYCEKNGKCVFNDLVNEVAAKFEEADGLVVGSPVYYGSPNGTILSFLLKYSETPKAPAFAVHYDGKNWYNLLVEPNNTRAGAVRIWHDGVEYALTKG